MAKNRTLCNVYDTYDELQVRDLFAKEAVAPILRDYLRTHPRSQITAKEYAEMAEASYVLADAMMLERAKE